MAKKQMGLLVMAYGTPYKEEDLERYYTHIRRGRKPSDEMLQDLRARYDAIGGISPLARITEDQAEALEDALNEKQDDVEFNVYLGLKHIEPFVEDAVAQMAEDGMEEAVAIVLAPHYSTYSVKSYNGRAKEEAEKHGITIQAVESWYDEPGFIDYWKEVIEAEYRKMDEAEKENACLIVSAHSLPMKILEGGDPYPDQLKKTAELISEATGITQYEIGWQSEGNTPDPWLGPDVQDLTEDLFKNKGYKSFVYAPVGFVSDHLEVLYDNDYECKVVCDKVGADYYRPEMPNTHPKFIQTLADVVMDKVKE
ncbi:ferrochelatase [Halobacillus karajensis]|uniref:Coproporphyrin III ferrochelatase n=1 Tax=Halobacillus karajensis TaxID=195088 RepID=A0A059NWD2_9BACI|nr:ferrochelatase [Halobacillus karajensis]CDQ21094.1 Ferrochelatase [Halobacillus karajensis]CDQ24842.1 Ferrochelatase [Halobacillus karajensis]CDQ28798.1 Ferrochelatase [Halobacillus karajensis]